MFIEQLIKFPVFFFLLVLSAPLWAVVDLYEFDTEADKRRFEELSEVLRCPKCQNQNLAGSDSMVAEDLRRELYRMISQGQSDSQIISFMVERYGEFVLYKPPVKNATLLLWWGPVILMVLGVLVWLSFFLKKRVGTPKADTQLSRDQSQRLEELLAQSSRPGSFKEGENPERASSDTGKRDSESNDKGTNNNVNKEG